MWQLSLTNRPSLPLLTHTGKGKAGSSCALPENPPRTAHQRKIMIFIQVNFQDNLISTPTPKKQGQQGLNLHFQCTPLLKPLASIQTPGHILHQHISAQLCWRQQNHVYFYQLRIWSSLLRKRGHTGGEMFTSFLPLVMLLPTPNTWHLTGLGSLGWSLTYILW